MVDFLQDSDSFCGLMFDGFYNMPIEDFEGLYNYYKETGENLLDDYTTVKHLMWEFDGLELSKVEIDDFNSKMSSVCSMMRINYFDRNRLREIQNKLRKALKNYTQWREYNSSRSVKRREANLYISDKKVRKQVFKEHGRECLCCGSKKELQIDHIKPVSKGGKNEIDNFQPLCKSCNVSKGTKTIDYRSK